MGFLFPAVLSTTIFTLILTLIYYYFYIQYQNKYFRIWAAAWCFYFLRFFFQILLITIEHNVIFHFLNQIFNVLSAFYLIKGTFYWQEKKFPKIWFLSLSGLILWIIIAEILKFSFTTLTLPIFTFVGTAFIITGYYISTNKKIHGIGKILTGISFIIWGLHKFNYPFLRPIKAMAVYGYLLASTLTVTVALGVILIYFELSKKSLQEALEKSKEVIKLKENILSLISHEFRTPLTGIMGFAELSMQSLEHSKKNKIDINELKENIQFIQKSSNRLNEVLSNLIEISVLESSYKDKINYTLFDINENIEKIFSLFSDKLKIKSLNYKININTENLIYHEPLRIHQILFHLIGNAVKFSNQGEINVALNKKNNFFVFIISDQGIGIPTDKQEKIFETFTQADDETNTRSFQGLGLGLAVCKKLIESLKGDINVKSEINKGSVFTVRIPVVKVKKDENKIKSPKTKTLSEEKNSEIKIMFAEDNVINKKLINSYLKRINNVTFEAYENGKQLIENFKKNQDNYDLIILDINMPEMSGKECLKEIKKINNKIPVFALTAHAMPQDKEYFINLGFDNFFTKPISFKDFKKEILNVK